jgi:hypothetical protein
VPPMPIGRAIPKALMMGLELLNAADRMKLEGIVSKRRDAPYRSGKQCELLRRRARLASSRPAERRRVQATKACTSRARPPLRHLSRGSTGCQRQAICMARSGESRYCARVAVNAYREFKADTIVAETNYGGAMVMHTIKTEDRGAPVKIVTATGGKVVRAEPISTLYARGENPLSLKSIPPHMPASNKHDDPAFMHCAELDKSLFSRECTGVPQRPRSRSGGAQPRTYALRHILRCVT